MSGKKAKAERQAEVAATVEGDPQALFREQIALARMAGAVECGEKFLAHWDKAAGELREALGVTKAAARDAGARVDALQKAAAKANGAALPEPPKDEAAAA